MAEAIKAYISTLDKKMKIFHQILSIFFWVNEKVIINGKLQEHRHMQQNQPQHQQLHQGYKTVLTEQNFKFHYNNPRFSYWICIITIPTNCIPGQFLYMPNLESLYFHC